MNAAESMLVLLSALPERKICGKKRLQKLAFLLKSAGADFQYDFSIWHYGVYSRDLADAADELVIFGPVVEADEPIEIYGRYQTVFSLPAEAKVAKKQEPWLSKLLIELDSYSAVELEVASSVLYYLNAGVSSAEAVSKTQSMKPTKATPKVLSVAKKIEQIIDAAKKENQTKKTR